MPWTIEYYEKQNGRIPVYDFLVNLSPKMKAKALREIDLLEEYGTNPNEVNTASIEGSRYKGIWELRIRFAGDISRIFYFTYSPNKIVLLSAFVKKTMKTPQLELDSALKYKHDYERSHSDET
jgi:phage-related protein